ncbi:uncharacterized protein LOC105188871 [Harpegnathos saltator]|uniref:DUF4806 domain-containing protein n=1 Tax=Harpegnathos saltator TaxID=610380 RepID=E2C199_HARSA|nr:uncharacterized protein LOC105188871 [Harpegnathos saltator]EFN78286.1 hypothetical protein EAI_06241 [Harpegnathos saltator]
MEKRLTKMETMLERILQCVESNQRSSTSSKLDILSISSVAELRAFEDIDEETYCKVMNYFHYIGSFNLKEAINLCFKESLQDAFTPCLTWWGREKQ